MELVGLGCYVVGPDVSTLVSHYNKPLVCCGSRPFRGIDRITSERYNRILSVRRNIARFCRYLDYRDWGLPSGSRYCRWWILAFPRRYSRFEMDICPS